MSVTMVWLPPFGGEVAPVPPAPPARSLLLAQTTAARLSGRGPAPRGSWGMSVHLVSGKALGLPP